MTHLYLLPGLLCDEAIWAKQADALSDVANITIPSYGTLDSLEAMAAHILETAPPRFSLAGLSMGARVALEIYRMSPDRIERLALLDTHVHAKAAGEEVRRYKFLEICEQRGMAALAEAWVPGMVHPERLSDQPFMNAVRDMVCRASPEIFRAQIKALLSRPDSSALLSRIACPTLVLCGREDTFTPPSLHEFMAGEIKGANLAVIESCGHLSTVERPDAVTAELRTWLSCPMRVEDR